MTLSLEGRHALVSGSTQGIGRACAVEFAKRGATVTLVARHAGGLEAVRGDLPTDAGQTHRSIQADFADWEAVRDRAAEHVAEHGPVHVLLNNSGGPPAGPAFEAECESES